MKRPMLIALAPLFLFATALSASGSSGGAGGGVPSAGVDPFTVTRTTKCTVTEIRPDGTIVVEDKKSNSTFELAITEETKFVAKNKSEFDGRKKLEAEDLQVGHQLKVLTREHNGEVLRVKVLKTA